MKKPPSPTPRSKPSAPPPATAAPIGRPTIRTPQLVAEICAAIRLDGLSDTMAGWLAGVSSSSISRWKKEDEDFATDLGQARAQYIVGQLRAIRAARKRDGSLDWRAQAWLLQRAAPDEFGPPSRRKPRTEEPPAAEPDNTPFVVTPEQLTMLQARRRIALEKMNGPAPGGKPATTPGDPIPTKAPGANIPETRFAHPAPASAARKPQPEPAAPCANIPEIPAKTAAAQAVSSAARPAAPAAHETTAESRRTSLDMQRLAAAEAEAHRRRVQSLLDAPDLYPASYYEQSRDQWSHDVPPGMWTGS